MRAIVDVEGIGEVYAHKLNAAGIDIIDDLLEECATPQARKDLAECIDNAAG